MKRFLIFLLLALSLPATSHAATMSLIPSDTTVDTGDIVTVRVVVNPGGTAVNNAEAVVRFPAGVLEVLSVSKAGSMFPLWVEDPSFSNGAGTVSFNGGVPNPGVSSAGTALSISFHAVRAGTASLSLSEAAVRANDGLGTDVLTGSSGTQITILSASAPVTPTTPVPTAPATGTGAAPVSAGPIAISSPTHPDSNIWYANTTPSFTWSLPKGATGVSLGIDQSPAAAPGVTYTTAITEKTVASLEDGTWYFRMKYRSGGAWSTISSYKVQIDSSLPEITNHTVLYDETERAVLIEVAGTDSGSGIERYDVSIDGAEPISVPASKFDGKSQSFPVRSSGIHKVTITAIDHAGNRVSVENSFSVSQSLSNQPLFFIGSFGVSLLAVLLAMSLFSMISLIAALFAWFTLIYYRHRKHPTVPAVRKDMHEGFLKIKSNMEIDIRALDRARMKRELSREEAMLYRRLVANVSALERHMDRILDDMD
ncbi:MAG: hypothetical protein AB199_01275 [Parcubacteria bacterium C7867-004]|nr:MAG: hypothetical protein AB199_01275 [Parcubacteria bacterium C7867-004]